MPFFDLASLAKPLVTAPLALAHLDLDRDRRGQLGFQDRTEPLTVRQLLSHASGLPPWRPYTGEPLARQLDRPLPGETLAKLEAGRPGMSLYSDLGYRLLAELLEEETGQAFPALGAAASGLSPAPWREAPPFVPQGADAGMWRTAEPDLPMPRRSPELPNDANARAGMRGHAGFGADPVQMRRCLEAWVASGAPFRMAQESASGEDGSRWGLGLQRALGGPGRFKELLDRIPDGLGGVHLEVETACEAPPPAPALEGRPGEAGAFWFHLGYTGPALFFRPSDGFCLGLLAHRMGEQGELLDPESLRARRWALLERAVERALGRLQARA